MDIHASRASLLLLGVLLPYRCWCVRPTNPSPFLFKEPPRPSSSFFLPLLLKDDEEPSGTEFSPDGGYIPRILFLNSAGDVQNDVYNKQGSDQYKYYYSDSGAVLKGMQDAAEHFA